MKRTLLLWLCLALMPVMVSAAPAEDPAGLEQLRKQAESGDVEAMLELGILYEFGFRMADNKAPALAWYRLAAESGNAKAGARQDALRGKMAAKDLDESNKLYSEYAATVRNKSAPAPAAPTVPAAPAMPAAPAAAEAPASNPK
jgi:TPR repeat protein